MVDESKHGLQILRINMESAKRQSASNQTVRQMYDLLGSNMTRIIPPLGADWKTDDEFEKWKRDVFLENLRKSTRYILLFDQQGLRGFVSYTAPNEGTEIYINEFQIHPRCQGDAVTFKVLLSCFLEEISLLPHDSIRTYTNKRNKHAQRLIEKIGFDKEGQTDRGIRYTLGKHAMQERFHQKPKALVNEVNRLRTKRITGKKTEQSVGQI